MRCRVKLSAGAGGRRGVTRVISRSPDFSWHFANEAEAHFSCAFAAIPGRRRYEVSTRPAVGSNVVLQTPDFVCAGFRAFPLGCRVLIAHPQPRKRSSASKD